MSWKKKPKKAIGKLSYGYGGGVITVKTTEVTYQELDLKQMPYKDYLQTKYWLLLSDRCKKRDGGRCKICNSTKYLIAHHRSYEYRGEVEKELRDLVCICQNCHNLFHKQP